MARLSVELKFSFIKSRLVLCDSDALKFPPLLMQNRCAPGLVELELHVKT